MFKHSNVYGGEESPKDTSVLWIHHKTKCDLSSPLVAEIFEKGKWKEISQNPEDLGMQIVELTYDGPLPQTGTLTQEQYDKLQSDNCLLVIKGAYYHKSFSGNTGGLDYMPLKLSNYMNGVRNTYFTVDGDKEWTLNYEKFVEANSGTATAELEKLKVGNTTYKITHPAPQYGLFVSGTRSGNVFTPSNDTVTYDEAVAAYLAGKNVILSMAADGYVAYSKVCYYLTQSGSDTQSMLVGYIGNGDSFDSAVWQNPDYQTNSPL